MLSNYKEKLNNYLYQWNLILYQHLKHGTVVNRRKPWHFFFTKLLYDRPAHRALRPWWARDICVCIIVHHRCQVLSYIIDAKGMNELLISTIDFPTSLKISNICVAKYQFYRLLRTYLQFHLITLADTIIGKIKSKWQRVCFPPRQVQRWRPQHDRRNFWPICCRTLSAANEWAAKTFSLVVFCAIKSWLVIKRVLKRTLPLS